MNAHIEVIDKTNRIKIETTDRTQNPRRAIIRRLRASEMTATRPVLAVTPVRIVMTAATPAIERTATVTGMTGTPIIARRNRTETEIRRATDPRVAAACVAQTSEFGSADRRATGW